MDDPVGGFKDLDGQGSKAGWSPVDNVIFLEKSFGVDPGGEYSGNCVKDTVSLGAVCLRVQLVLIG